MSNEITRCWWEEGGRCYEGTPNRDNLGRSFKVAKCPCSAYWDKRSALTTLIPNNKLVILSELK